MPTDNTTKIPSVQPTDQTGGETNSTNTTTVPEGAAQQDEEIAADDLIKYIAGGVGLLIIVVLIFLQMFLKNGLPCCRCCKTQNEFSGQS